VLRARLRSSLAAKRMRDVERGNLRRLEAVVTERESALLAEIAALRAESTGPPPRHREGAVTRPARA
jgi:hypothetical protein